MANYVLKELPEEMSDGKKVVYPKIQTYSLHDYETALKHMRPYAANLSDGVMRTVIGALVQMMKSWMPLGHTIKIDGLGVFSLSLGFDTDTPQEQAIAEAGPSADMPPSSYRHVRIKGINFKPDAQLLADLNGEATFDRTENGVKTAQKSKYSREDRLALARTIIGRQGYMTLSDYSLATGLSRSSASRELRQLAADATTGLTTRGAASHKVWVLAAEHTDLC